MARVMVLRRLNISSLNLHGHDGHKNQNNRRDSQINLCGATSQPLLIFNIFLYPVDILKLANNGQTIINQVSTNKRPEPRN